MDLVPPCSRPYRSLFCRRAPAEQARVHVYFDLTQVVDGELLDGTMHVTGRLPEGLEPFETRVRLEFHDDADGRTRLAVRQWLPEHLASLSEQGWLESFTKLDATLAA